MAKKQTEKNKEEKNAEIEKEKIKTESAEIKNLEKEDETQKKEKGHGKKAEIKKVQQKVKKTEVYVNAKSVHGSVKTASAICRFIKYKEINKALEDLEKVAKMQKVVPMKGEIPHRKGRGVMAGRFPQKTAKQFIVLLKSLKANADNHDVENPVIVEAIPNKAYLPFGKMGRIRRKRFHLRLKAIEKKKWYNSKKGGKK